MKLLIVSFYYYPDLCAGSFRCAALIEQLKKVAPPDLEILLITTMPNRYSTFEAKASETEQQSQLTIKRIQLPEHQSGMLDQAKAFLYFAKQAKKITRGEHFDLVFATSSRLMTAVLGSFIAWEKKTKLYLDIRDIFVDTIGEILPPQLSRFCKPLFSFLEKWAVKQADCINLVSRGFEPWFASRYPQKSFTWFSNGVDDEFAFVKSQKKKDQPGKRLTVLYAGNIGEGQGLHLIIPELAWRMREAIEFKIFGDGGRRSQLLSKLEELGCENVQILPPVTRTILIEEYQKADVLFLHLNDYEAFKKVLPSKIFEYAALGKPIWAGVAGYSAEFIHTELPDAVVFPPCDSLAAEQKFRELNFEPKNRCDFIKKYSRESIMKDMASDILRII